MSVIKKSYFKEKRLFESKTLKFQEDKSRFQIATQEYTSAQEIVTKLEKTKVLIASLQRDDETRYAEITVQNNKITPLWTALHDKVVRGLVWNDTDKANYTKIIQAEDVIKEIHTHILQNKQRIERCHHMANTYDAAHAGQFAGHWVSLASTVLEQQDIYGFRGEILQRNPSNTSKTCGLEGYGVGYGALLKKREVVSYTLPGTKIKIEQDHLGKLINKTPPNLGAQEKTLAAIKMAHLLLLDMTLHPQKQIYLRGSKDYLPQVKLVVAALMVEAKQAGIVLKFSDIKVDVPGWTNFVGLARGRKLESDKLQMTISGTIDRYYAKDDFKEKISEIKGKTLLIDEPAYRPRHR
jgi:hypothetical protein